MSSRRLTALALAAATLATGPVGARGAPGSPAAPGRAAAPWDGPYRPPVLTDHRTPHPPWKRRALIDAPWQRLKGPALIDLDLWPAEPASPRRPLPERLGLALRRLCRHTPPALAQQLARWVLRFAREHRVDPFLLGALPYARSGCRPDYRSRLGVGLTAISHRMHADSVVDGQYRYGLLHAGAWRPTALPLRYAFTPRELLRAKPNLYFAAALLSIFAQQCRHVDGAFRSVPHRHFVSHFIWGDRVADAAAEDRVLRARRRLIGYYRGDEGAPAPPLGRLGALRLDCPLEGAPRKITSVLGDDREDGRRLHTGVDFYSETGEPVRAVADGRVALAGVDRGHDQLESLPAAQARLLPNRQLGPRGLLVTVAHTAELSSVYMHLDEYTVEAGQQVRRGAVIGYVGRTGMRVSSAHLHFELHLNGLPVDPVPALLPYAFVPAQTYRGRRVAAEQHQRRLAREHQRRLRSIIGRPPCPPGCANVHHR